ncbi:MAP7 domain-containing protein 1-like [Littorina saxatilis]|uniref:Uncharacterized protein n=1 Tax=Littorina saxatilis TaxID=31220 RepID=A0AAN9GF16_9CAEN
MGCGSSTIGIAAANEQTQTDSNTDRKSTRGNENGVSSKGRNNNKKTANNNAKSIDTNGNTVKMDQTPVPKAVAFDVSLDGQNTELLLTKKAPVPRLQALEPLDVPKLSAEQLAEKQRQAEEKRDKVRQKRASASKKASRRRQELIKAKEFEAQQQLQQEKAIDENQKQAELKREARLREVKEKQRLREERAKRAREKAKKISQGDEGDDLDVEKDENFNASDVDSWLGDDEPTQRTGSGRLEHVKRVQSAVRKPASASTVDSYDAAFQRKPQTTTSQLGSNFEQHDDEFFGS